MAIRALASDVRSIIDTDDDVILDPFISTANALTDQVSAADTDSQLSSNLLQQIEIHLAAHFYQAHRDRNYKSKTTGRASATFQGETGKNLYSTDPGQTAMMLDATGYLYRMSQDKRPTAGFGWLGKRPSDQTDYIDRD
jgi:hypothetical protein